MPAVMLSLGLVLASVSVARAEMPQSQFVCAVTGYWFSFYSYKPDVDRWEYINDFCNNEHLKLPFEGNDLDNFVSAMDTADPDYFKEQYGAERFDLMKQVSLEARAAAEAYDVDRMKKVPIK